MNEYWSGKGKYQKEYEELYNVLVPRSGEADTKLGEILRISGNVYYRFYNDGDVISRGLFTKMKPYEKKIKAEMTHPEYYDFYKKMVSNPSIRRDLEGRVQSEDGLEFRRVMNATIDGIIKFIYKEYKTGKLKSRKMYVDLYPPGNFQVNLMQ